eukprot:TRINITY_DN65551_c0_g1_i1.p1 TRINITY_DN65551_c0_g1~~TRINITY_DN65551_c0_g1_i1.p1  ORF type:complete len:296 (-),score=30.65 TRINITY_DN65551_c0_g1_i1:707-1594(-)
MKHIYKEFVLRHQHNQSVFCNRTEEKEEELVFYKHLVTLSGFLEASHLEIDKKLINSYTLIYLTERNSFTINTIELSKIHNFRTPKDKMVVLINFITVIARSSTASDAERSKERFSEIDKFLPLVIYYLVKIQPMMLKSTLRFIRLFRNRGRFVSAEGYYHALMSSAVNFIEKVGPEQLDMKPEVFEANYALHEKLSGAKIEEQMVIWRYGPAFMEKAEKKKDEQAKKILKEVKNCANKTKGILSGGFDKMSISQLKQIVEAQAQILEALKKAPYLQSIIIICFEQLAYMYKQKQ